MKKKLVILLINVFIFSIFFFSLEHFFKQNFLIEKYEDKYVNLLSKSFARTNANDFDISNEYVEENTVRQIELNETTLAQYCSENRTEIGMEYKNKPISILGCSYAYGHGLKKEETFPYLLSIYTKRPIYNFASCGSHILDSKKRLQDYIQSNQNSKTNDSEYVIYMYMYDHINRCLRICNVYNYYYELFEPTSFIEKTLCKSATIRYIATGIKIKKILKDFPQTEQSSELLKKIIIYSLKDIKKTIPNSKVIIVIYNEKTPKNHHPARIKFNIDIINSKIWKELEEEENLKVVYTKDIMGFLFDKNYKLEEDIADWHPNKKVWQEFTPLFAKKYID